MQGFALNFTTTQPRTSNDWVSPGKLHGIRINV